MKLKHMYLALNAWLLQMVKHPDLLIDANASLPFPSGFLLWSHSFDEPYQNQESELRLWWNSRVWWNTMESIHSQQYGSFASDGPGSQVNPPAD